MCHLCVRARQNQKKLYLLLPCYRLEGQAQTGRQQWGAIFSAQQPESLILYDAELKGDKIERFGDWKTGPKSLGPYVPYIDNDTSVAMLLRTKSSRYMHGTIVSRQGVPYEEEFNHSPWMEPEAEDSGTVLYWIREN